LRVPEVAALLAATYGERNSVTERAVQNWTRHPVHPLPSTRVGHRTLIHRSDLARWLASRANGRASAGDERHPESDQSPNGG
jgi:hypothetical protein